MWKWKRRKETQNDWNFHRANSWKRGKYLFCGTRENDAKIKRILERKSLFMRCLCLLHTHTDALISDYTESMENRLMQIIIIICSDASSASIHSLYSLSLNLHLSLTAFHHTGSGIEKKEMKAEVTPQCYEKYELIFSVLPFNPRRTANAEK